MALSPTDGRLRAGDVNTDGNITTGLQYWNTEYETINGMPVYYGGALYESEDSDWDDPYALASAAYVENYYFDFPDGMDLMVHHHSRNPDSLDVLQDCQTDMVPVCQTVSYATRNEWDTIDNDSLTEAADADDPNMEDFYQQVVSSYDEDLFDSDDGSVTDLDRDMSEAEDCVDSDDGSVADLGREMTDEEECCDSDDKTMLEDEDFVDSDVGCVADLDSDMSDDDEEDCRDSVMGSVADLEWDTWADVCTLAFQGTMGAFPPEAAGIRPAVVFGNSLFPGDECADAVVLVRRDIPMSAVLQVTSKRVDRIPPVSDQHVQRTVSGSVGWDTYGVRLCLLYPDSMEDLQDLQGGSVDGQRLDHWRTVSWDPGIADSRALSVCYDCLCLMALFRTVMSLARYWAVEIVWTGPDKGSCRSMAWEERYLPRLYPPCVVDRLYGYTTEIVAWTNFFMMLRLWIWVMCRNHLFPFRNCRQWPPAVISHMG